MRKSAVTFNKHSLSFFFLLNGWTLVRVAVSAQPSRNNTLLWPTSDNENCKKAKNGCCDPTSFTSCEEDSCADDVYARDGCEACACYGRDNFWVCDGTQNQYLDDFFKKYNRNPYFWRNANQRKCMMKKFKGQDCSNELECAPVKNQFGPYCYKGKCGYDKRNEVCDPRYLPGCNFGDCVFDHYKNNDCAACPCYQKNSLSYCEADEYGHEWYGKPGGGECVSKKDIGENCTLDIVCLSNVCGKKSRKCVKSAGLLCTNDDECDSENCVNGACYATKKCKALKHDVDTAFNEKQVLLIFVPSNFDDQADWEDTIVKTFKGFNQTKAFSESVGQYTALYSSEIGSGLVDFYWSNDRLLGFNPNDYEEKNLTEARRRGNNCFPGNFDSFNGIAQLVIVHKSSKDGAGGYTNQRMNVAAITSVEGASPRALHELGHSLFKLGDEYNATDTNINLPKRAPNCDYRNEEKTACSRWKDLIGNEDVEKVWGKIGCYPGCREDTYAIGQVSLMKTLKNVSDYGAVNYRYICCTYLANTCSMPDFCYTFGAFHNISSFCKNNNYQKYRSFCSPEQSEEVNERTRIDLYLKPDGGLKEAIFSTIVEPDQIEFSGDYSSRKKAKKAGEKDIYEVVLKKKVGKKKKVNYLFKTQELFGNIDGYVLLDRSVLSILLKSVVHECDIKEIHVEKVNLHQKKNKKVKKKKP